MHKLPFEILIHDSFLSPDRKEESNKFLLSIINDFEDKEWRYENFDDFIWNNISQTALSKRERDALIEKPMDILKKSVRNLRLSDKDIKGQGSEIAEILLYGIMKEYYSALPVVPKIFYKQNPQDNAKGADSVHIVLTDNDYSVWYGECKFYNDISTNRLDSIVTSVLNSLETNKIKKENSIITNLQDLEQYVDNTTVLDHIKNFLSVDNSMDKIKPKIHIPICLLYECSETNKTKLMTNEYRCTIKKYHLERFYEYFAKQDKKKEEVNLYEQITFHLILFPVPSKEEVINNFMGRVKLFRN